MTGNEKTPLFSDDALDAIAEEISAECRPNQQEEEDTSDCQ
ncbi:hypothetical protein V1498_03510 [Peribacillus sp. SCS-26]